MKELYPLFAVLLVVGLIVKFFWWIVVIGAIVGVGYIVYRQSVKTSPGEVRAVAPESPQTRSAPPVQQRRTVRTAPAAARAAAPTTPRRQSSLRPMQPTPRPPARQTNGKPTVIQRSLLTRAVTGVLAQDQIFTAVDLETTGLFPSADRIVEIGLVKFRGSGEILDEFATLVYNPGSSPEAHARHQIDDSDLIGAPTIDQVLPEVFAFMAGTVVVAHKLEFEEGFLVAAAQRNALSFPRHRSVHPVGRSTTTRWSRLQPVVVVQDRDR